jgi:hypothetical protein
MRAALMNEKNMPEFATILAFDVRVDPEAAAMVPVVLAQTKETIGILN